MIERFNLKRVSRAYFVEHLCAPYRAPRSPNAPPTGARAPLNVPVPDFLFRTALDLFCSIYIVRRKWCMLTAASAASRVRLVGAAAPLARRARCYCLIRGGEITHQAAGTLGCRASATSSWETPPPAGQREGSGVRTRLFARA